MGIGFGTSRFDGISNMLRMSVYRTVESTSGVARSSIRHETIAVIEFEIDDQSPEDLAVGLDNLRSHDGVVDVLQHPVFVKKGRVASQIQVLARSDAIDAIARACFTETSTLGLRWFEVNRQVLRRSEGVVEDQDPVAGSRRVRYKQASRPKGDNTVKAEMDDVGATGLSYAGRSALRRRVEALIDPNESIDEDDAAPD